MSATAIIKTESVFTPVENIFQMDITNIHAELTILKHKNPDVTSITDLLSEIEKQQNNVDQFSTIREKYKTIREQLNN